MANEIETLEVIAQREADVILAYYDAEGVRAVIAALEAALSPEGLPSQKELEAFALASVEREYAECGERMATPEEMECIRSDVFAWSDFFGKDIERQFGVKCWNGGHEVARLNARHIWFKI
jgi:hypothetical protein